ncbi:protein angel homolog 1-like isoform X2 [Portunus trituberculatus]|uniref:protein angel homolog 1-like isoform X2 n=1 Tax=Portunus trituberculatus TaxID=210409 RepID=UPI001E1CBECF|nr:protein angel homolog 1-like isoform X2 [Portunus trituberculatus]
MSVCMPGWLAGRLVVGLCGGSRHHAAEAAATVAELGVYGRATAQVVRAQAMAAKRGGEALSPVCPTRRKRRPCNEPLDFISLSQTPPRTSNPAGNLDLGSFIFIDTTPTPVPDAPAPPSYRRIAPHAAHDVEVVDVSDTSPRPRHSSASDSDIAVVYEGPRLGGTGLGGPTISQQRGCHTKAQRGINTRATAAPALAPAEDDDQPGEVEVVDQEPCRNTEVEVIQVDSVEHHHQQQQQEEEVEGEQVVVVDRDSDSERRTAGSGGGNSVGDVVVDSDSNSSSSSGGEDEVIDVSGEGFVSLGGLAVQHLENTTIDLSDEVLRRRRHLEALRPWERTGLGGHVARHGLPSGAVPLTVVSYNVLAQSLLRDNPGLYRGCGVEELAWEYRWALLQHEVEGMQPDVLLLQEVEARHYHSHYLPWMMSRGFQGLYKKRTGTKADGCAIFYHADKWLLAEHTSVEYRQPRAPDVLDRDNVGLIARLVPRQCGGGNDGGDAGVVVATTHLLYNPRRHDVKLAQVAVLLAELDRMCYMGQASGQPRYCPMVVAGDLNAEPHTALLSFLLEGRLQYEGLGRRTLTRHCLRGAELGAELLPPALGITRACQHAALAQGRWLERQHGPIISPVDKRRLEEALIHLHHSDRPNTTPASTPATTMLHDPSQWPGWLSHALLLHSVYRRQRGRGMDRGGAGPEVTTFQERWMCVDYLLYSRVRRHTGPATEGRLKLLERLTLPTPREAALFSPMPSPVCPSDHFPLAARFMLLHNS